MLGCPPSQDASGKWRSFLGSPTNVKVQVVTMGRGTTPRYMIHIRSDLLLT